MFPLVYRYCLGSHGGVVVKNPPVNGRRCRFDPWVGKMPWRRARQPSPVLPHGQSHAQRSLVVYSSWITSSQTCLRRRGTCPPIDTAYLNHSAHTAPFPGGSDSTESACDAGEGFGSCVGKIPWRKEWLPTPVVLPGESHGQRSLVGNSPLGRRVGHD